MGGTCSCHSILCKELVIVRILKFAPLALTYAFYGQNVKAMNMNLLKAWEESERLSIINRLF